MASTPIDDPNVFKNATYPKRVEFQFATRQKGKILVEITTNQNVLTNLLSVTGKTILDIGSGDGNLVRFLTRHGAVVTGLECGAAQLEAAKSYAPVGDETYVEGVAQQLPFTDNSFDISIFFNSLHHVPTDQMAAAIFEAKRVTRPKGLIYIAEPIAEGSGHEFSAPLDDETFVRKVAYECIQHAMTGNLNEISETFYDTVYHYEAFDSFKEHMIRIEPARIDAFKRLESSLRVEFERIGVRDGNGVRFDQPMRVNLLATQAS